MNEILLQFIQTLDTSMKEFMMQSGTTLSQLTLHQIQYLEAVAALESPTISEIAFHMNFSKPSVTDAVKKLEGLGFVHKERSTDDRRVVHVCLTNKGKQIQHTQQQTMQHYLDFIQTTLDEEEQIQFKQTLEKLVAAFEKQHNITGEQA